MKNYSDPIENRQWLCHRDNVKFKIIFIGIVFFGIFGLAKSSGSTTLIATSCSYNDVSAALSTANSGDTVTVPIGTCTWGESGRSLSVPNGVKLQGESRTQTQITIADSAPSWGAGTIALGAGSKVKNLTIYGSTGASNATAFSAASPGFVISEITYVNSAVDGGYLLYSEAYGVFADSDITGGSGTDELIFARGPADSWQTADSMGGANNLFGVST
jgi:hypothetical protein